MKRKSVIKDICPRCHTLKPMPEMKYGKYRELCKDCETEVMFPDKNIALYIVMAVLSAVVFALLLQVRAQGQQLERIQVTVYDVDSRTEILK